MYAQSNGATPNFLVVLLVFFVSSFDVRLIAQRNTPSAFQDALQRYLCKDSLSYFLLNSISIQSREGSIP